MTAPQSTFSESWYRIAGQRVWLRPDAIIRRQRFRGERWFVLQNPFASRYFRIRPPAYEFVARLTPERTVEGAWLQCVEKFPDEAPGQEAVLQLLAQLYFANLLQYDVAADSEQLFPPLSRRGGAAGDDRPPPQCHVHALSAPRSGPVPRPDDAGGRAIDQQGGRVAVVGGGRIGRQGGDGCNAPALRAPRRATGFSPRSNLLAHLLYAALVGIKAIHEFGHAYVCRKFGGEVHVMGVLLMIFTPVPYVDTSSSWGFRNRWQRVAVGSAGMIAEVFVAALATFVWAKSGPGLVHSLCYNVMFVASVSTVIFNANPLLRFDGYYILSDLLEIPNLSQRSSGELRHLWEYGVYGVRPLGKPGRKLRRERRSGWWCIGILSGIYRVIVVFPAACSCWWPTGSCSWE